MGGRFTTLWDPISLCSDSILRSKSAAFFAAAARRGVPMAVLDVHADDAAELYPRKLLLSRPDRHVAWRGDRPPDDPLALIDRVRGALAGEAVLQRAQAPTFALDPSSRLSAAQPVT